MKFARIGVLAATLTAAFAPVALADGVYRGSMKDSVAPLPFSWTGVYVGAHIGRGWSDSSWTVRDDQTTFVDFPPGGIGSPLTSHSLDGWVGGGHVGYQQQFGSWVLGAELSYAGTGLDGTSVSVFQGLDDTYKTKVNDLFLASLRVGYAWDRWLAYVKGGYAQAEVKASIVDTNGAAAATGTWSSKETHGGYNLGAGLEYGLTQNIIIGVQYDFIDLGAKTHTAAGLTGNGLSQQWGGTIDVDSIHVVTGRLSFKF
jgi:outer membrane immunogenic protein